MDTSLVLRQYTGMDASGKAVTQVGLLPEGEKQSLA